MRNQCRVNAVSSGNQLCIIASGFALEYFSSVAVKLHKYLLLVLGLGTSPDVSK